MIVEVGKIDWYEYIRSFGLEESKKNKRRSQSKHRLLNVYAAFDIETSTVWINPDHKQYDVHSFMYVWQFQLEEYTVKGRTWEEFFAWLNVLRDAIGRIRTDQHLEINPLLIIWVHNLSYEFTFSQNYIEPSHDGQFFRL